MLRLRTGKHKRAVTPALKLLVGLRYRVEGILHEYLGPARLPGRSDIAHVFLRNEWRPNTAGQLPITLVGETEVDRLVTKTRIRGSGRGVRT